MALSTAAKRIHFCLAADEDGVYSLLALRIGLEAHLHHLGIPDDCVERSPYVVAHRREEVAPRLTRALLGLDLLLEKTILAPAQDVEEAYDYRERRDEQKQLDAHLRQHVCAHVPENALHHARIDGLSDERAERRLGRVAYREADPHERREEDQDENADPDDDGVPEAREPVDEEHVP